MTILPDREYPLVQEKGVAPCQRYAVSGQMQNGHPYRPAVIVLLSRKGVRDGAAPEYEAERETPEKLKILFMGTTIRRT